MRKLICRQEINWGLFISLLLLTVASSSVQCWPALESVWWTESQHFISSLLLIFNSQPGSWPTGRDWQPWQPRYCGTLGKLSFILIDRITLKLYLIHCLLSLNVLWNCLGCKTTIKYSLKDPNFIRCNDFLFTYLIIFNSTKHDTTQAFIWCDELAVIVHISQNMIFMHQDTLLDYS